MPDFTVLITLSCPTCGAEAYEVDLTAAEVDAGTQVSIPCDDCSNRFLVDVEVRVQVPRKLPGSPSMTEATP